MTVCIVTPAPRGSQAGNRVTACRWQRIFEQLGFTVELLTHPPERPPEVLVALHAIKSADAVHWVKHRWPDVPVVLALTGTDVYHPLRRSARGLATARMADRLVVLQPLAFKELPADLHARTRVIYQSVAPPLPPHRPPADEFRVCVLGHLRALKDPFRAAAAARQMPVSSRLMVYHAGGVLEAPLLETARQEHRTNPRYRWLGELPAYRARQLMASSHLLVHSSLKEGGANVVSEAIALGLPVLASRIPGNVGLLGPDYPGYFPPQDTATLVALLRRAETNRGFYRELKKGVQTQQPVFFPEKEVQAWRELLLSLGMSLPG